jgi:hypothetical protein
VSSCPTSIINRSSSSLLRRRSLVTTSGVVARNSPVEGIRRTWNSWKTPKLDEQEEAKWRVDTMGKSPLARLAALDLAEEAHRSPTPRAQTPGELEYSHLGSLQLGSLRVTNGEPSPAPSTRLGRRRSNPNLSCGEDYFTPAEPYDTPLMMKTTKRRGHGRSKSTIEPPTPPLYRRSLLSDQTRRAKTTSRCDSPRKVQPQSQPHLDDNEPEPVRRLRVMNKSADTLTESLANANAAGLALSPTHIPDDQDEGFVPDEAEAFQNEALRLLNGTIFTEPTATVDLPHLKLSLAHITNTSTLETNASKKVNGRPPPKKADSGYSSGGSFTTVHRDTSKATAVPTLSQQSAIATNGYRSGSSNSDKASDVSTLEQLQHSPDPEPNLRSLLASDNVLPSPSLSHRPQGTVLQHPSPLVRVQDAHSPDHDSPMSPVSIASQSSINIKSSTQRRLQKRRPSIPELPVVQACEPILEGTVPVVPTDVRSKFVRRLSETPGMDCLTRTYPSKDHISDASSIAGSTTAAVSIRFPSPPTTPQPRNKHEHSVAEQPTPPRPSGLRRSLSLFRSKSKSNKQEKEVAYSLQESHATPGVLDLGTIAISLGQSPYDAALGPTRRKSVTTPTHPHQLGGVMSRTKSMVSMDAETAVEFARMRSKDRAQLRPSMPQRPQSFHDIYRRQTHNLYEHVPSVPSIPSVSTLEVHKPSDLPDPEPVQTIQQDVLVETQLGTSFRDRTSGRDIFVSESIEKFDHNGQLIVEQQLQDWQPHARLWSQRRKSIGEGLRQRAEEESQAQYHALAKPVIPQAPPQYTGTGIRQLHSYASRRSAHFNQHHGVELSHVPRFLERA